MAICAVCYVNCRGTCKKCGARLCAHHMPAPRAKCQICPPSLSRRGKSVAGGALTLAGTPYYIPTSQPAQKVYTPARKPLDQMDKLESCQHLEDLQARLLAKQKREKAYLDRRAARGTDTPTDEAYRRDQELENELLEMLAFLLSQAEK